MLTVRVGVRIIIRVRVRVTFKLRICVYGQRSNEN